MSYRILIIADSPDFLRYLSALSAQTIDSRPLQITLAGSLDSARQKLAQTACDLLIGPLRANNGFVHFAEELRTSGQSLIILGVVAAKLSEFERTYAQIFCSSVLEANTTPAGLVATVRGALTPAAPAAPAVTLLPPQHAAAQRSAAAPRRGSVLSVAQIGQLRAELARLGREVGVRCSMLVDLSGQEIVHWSIGDLDNVPGIAALTASDMLAALELGRIIGGLQPCNVIIQEHDHQTVFLSRVGEGLILLLVTARDVPLGWSRLALRQSSAKMQEIVMHVVPVPSEQPLTDDFERQLAAKIDTLW